MKPRAAFCWHCGKQLYQRKVFVEVIIDGFPRILHKTCAKTLKENPDAYYEESE